jgi:uncharacterized membrane protein
MPMIGWLFLLLALAMIIGSLLMLRDSANMRMSDETREKVRKRQAEVEIEEENRGDR